MIFHSSTNREYENYKNFVDMPALYTYMHSIGGLFSRQ